MTKAKKKDDTLLFGEQEVTLPPEIEPAPVTAKAKPKPTKQPKNEIAVRPVPAVPDDPFLSMIREVALRPDLDVAKLDALLKMQERIRDRVNKEAFDAALARMQPELPVIDRKGRIEVRKKDAHGERTGDVQQSTQYAKWEDIVEGITAILGKHGFGLRFKPSNTDKGLIRVEGTLSGHGHREEAAIELQHDSTGSKNPVQSIASSISYGKRMVGCALLNIVTRGDDDDGKAGGGAPLVVGEPLTAEELEQVIALAGAVECPAPRLLQHLNSKRPKGHPPTKEIADLPHARFQETIDALRLWEAEAAKRTKRDDKEPPK